MNFDKFVREFNADGPFPNAVIDNVFPDKFVSELAEEVDSLQEDGKWFVYDNGLEKKHAREALPEKLRDVALGLQSKPVVAMLSKLVGVTLQPNPDLRGAGLHRISTGGKLDLHLDHNRYMGLERRLNLIYWFHDVEWQSEWQGNLELWSERNNVPYECIRSIMPKRNRMALFECSESSFHGHPIPLKCPVDVCRTSLALYYYTDEVSDVPPRERVKFFPRPADPKNTELDALRSARAAGESVYR